MSAPDWTWPLPTSSPINPNVENEWLTADATQVVVGQVNQGGVHMTTAAVSGSPPVLEGSLWLSLHFSSAELEDTLVSGWDADPDSDGWNNLAEFAYGLNPRQDDSPSVGEKIEGGFFEFTLSKAEKAAVDYFGQVSSDLVSWSEAEASVFLVEETATTLTYRDLVPLGSGPRFGRVRVALQP